MLSLQLLIGVFIGAAFMFVIQLVGESGQRPQPSFPRALPDRVETLARWGRVRVTKIVSRPSPTSLPMRTPGTALVLNPVVATWHVLPVAHHELVLEWLMCQLRRLWAWCLRPLDKLDPLGGWDMQAWWYDTFYGEHRGTHRVREDDVVMRDPAWAGWPTMSWPVLEQDFTDSHNRRVRTQAEWDKIIATNKRTKAVRDAHRARRAGLVWQDDTLVPDYSEAWIRPTAYADAA